MIKKNVAREVEFGKHLMVGSDTMYIFCEDEMPMKVFRHTNVDNFEEGAEVQTEELECGNFYLKDFSVVNFMNRNAYLIGGVDMHDIEST